MLRVWLLSQHGASDLMPVQTAPSSTQSSRACFAPAQTVAHGVGTIVESMGVILWGFSSLWFLPSELHQQVGHSVRQKKITTYFPFLDMSWLGIKSLARDTGPGDTQGSPAHTVAQSHLDPSLSSTTLQGQLLLSLCSGMTRAPWSMGSTLPGLVLDSFEWLISVSSAGFQGLTDAGSGGGGCPWHSGRGVSCCCEHQTTFKDLNWKCTRHSTPLTLNHVCSKSNLLTS